MISCIEVPVERYSFSDIDAYNRGRLEYFSANLPGVDPELIKNYVGSFTIDYVQNPNRQGDPNQSPITRYKRLMSQKAYVMDDDDKSLPISERLGLMFTADCAQTKIPNRIGKILADKWARNQDRVDSFLMIRDLTFKEVEAGKVLLDYAKEKAKLRRITAFAFSSETVLLDLLQDAGFWPDFDYRNQHPEPIFQGDQPIYLGRLHRPVIV